MALTQYMADIAPYAERLSPTEEHRLFRLARQGDRSARERLITANLPLVISIAKDFRAPGVLFEDLISAGNIGLLRAVDCFDPDHGIRFSLYARHAIRSHCHTHLALDRPIRIPEHVLRSNYRVDAAIRTLKAAGEEPTNERIRAQARISPTRLRAVQQLKALSVIPLDDTLAI